MGERQSTRRSAGERVVDALRHVAFWTAVLLPLAVGSVVLPQLGSAAQWRLFFVLAATSVIALYIGVSSNED